MIAFSSILAHSKRVPTIAHRTLPLLSSSSSSFHSSAMASQQDGPVTTSIRTTVTSSSNIGKKLLLPPTIISGDIQFIVHLEGVLTVAFFILLPL
jgi:hypothetical protein